MTSRILDLAHARPGVRAGLLLGASFLAVAFLFFGSSHGARIPEAVRAEMARLARSRSLDHLTAVEARLLAAAGLPVRIPDFGDDAFAHYAAPVWPGALGMLPALPMVSLVEPIADEAVPANAGDVIDGIDYSDPVSGGVVPLVRVAGRWSAPISRSFRYRDFASRDGAPYARVADRLVNVLEQVRRQAGSLMVISGYRHRSYNEQIEGSAAGSQHISGRAADVWSGTKTPLQLAAFVLKAGGCSVGLGLGANTLHVDVRGRLASWTYPGAAMSEAAFDAWVSRQCGGARPADAHETGQADVHDHAQPAPGSVPEKPDTARVAATADTTSRTVAPASRPARVHTATPANAEPAAAPSAGITAEDQPGR